MTIKLTRPFFDSLDLVLVQSPNVPQPRIRGVSYQGRPYEGNDVVIFGAVLARSNISGRFPSPLLRFGPPKEELFDGKKRYLGLQAGKVSDDGCLPLEKVWESTVTVYSSGPSIYAGQGNHFDAVLFSEPLPFDPEKELLFARSPNGKIMLDRLHTENFEEDLIPVWYSLVKEGGAVRRYDATQENLVFLWDKDQRKETVREVMIEDNEGQMTLHINEGKNRKLYNISLEQLLLLDFETLSIATCSLPEIPKQKTCPTTEEKAKYPYSLIYANPQELQTKNTHLIRNEYSCIYFYNVK